MRILHIASHDAFFRGGAVQLLRMSRGLSLRGHRVAVVLNRSTCEGLELPEDFDFFCIRLSAFSLLRLLRLSREFDVIHAHKPVALRIAFFTVLVLRKPVVFQRGTTYPVKGFSRWCLKAFPIFTVAVSHAVRRALVECGVPEERIFVVYGSAPFLKINKKPSSSFRLGIVAALKGKKGYPLFFCIASRIAEKLSKVKFLVFGSGSKEKFREHYKGIEGLVCFMGHEEDLEKIYSGLDMLLCTSLKGEGFTGSVREAMLYSVPVATTPVSGNPEFIDGAHTGLIIDKDCGSASSCILKGIFNPKKLKKLSANAFVLSCRFFSIERQAENLERVYGTLL